MKKIAITIASVAILGFTTMVSAQGAMFVYVNDLTIGSSNPEVYQLQTLLISLGFDIPAISSGVAQKGYFGAQTRAAVMRYQTSRGVISTGYVGPLTRSQLNGGDSRGESLRITSPNGGDVWQRGTYQNITWSGAPGILNQTGDIWLQSYIPPCAEPTNTIRCMIAVQAPRLIAQNINLNSLAYNWSVGSLVALSDIYNPIPDGQYKIKICPTNSSACDTSDTYFQINSGTVTVGAPVINGIDAPITLTVGQTGTWTVRASDPNNQSLSYSVDWGDTPLCPAGYSCGLTLNSGTLLPYAQQNTTFTHSFASTGTYTIKFTVKNSSGLIAQTSSTVNVIGSTQAGPLKITSPNGGETWQKGATYNITWTSPAYFRATYADIKLIPYYQPCTSQVCPMGAQTNSSQTSMMYPYIAPYTIATNLSINNNSYSWVAGNVIPVSASGYGIATNVSVVPDGQYSVQICESGGNNCDTSDVPFTITSTTNAPTVKVVSPNGGEVWPANSTHQLIWTTASSYNSNQSLDIYLDQANIYCITTPCGHTYTLDRNIAASTIYNWIVATDISNFAIPAADYRVRVCTAGSTTNCDSSDNAFTISARQY